MKFLIVISLAVFIHSCNNTTNSKLPHSVDDFSLAIPKDTNTLYYPLDSLRFVSDNNIKSDSFIKSIYSEILFNLKEPVLYNYKGNSETVRLLWVRAFDNPVMVRASKWRDSLYINVKELGKKFYGNDFVYQKKIDTSFVLASTNRWNDIFNLSSYDTLNDGSYKDATAWVLEYNLQGNYHCINRLYLDTFSLAQYPIAKKLYDIGSSVLSMKSRWEQQ